MATDCLISVVCSTYNRPDALGLTLSSLRRQNDRHFEVLVADDGSTDETRRVVRDFTIKAPFTVRHVWHEDRGFRLAAIRNLALSQARGEYVLFLDGDCIASPHWIGNHRLLAEAGWTVSGQRILTTQDFCREIVSRPDFADDFDWSVASLKRLAREKKINRWHPGIFFGVNTLCFWRKWRPSNWKIIRGCNWGMWRRDLERAGGFNEAIVGWGHEDSDLAIRLMNNGVRFKSGSFATVVLHLWHKEANRDKAAQNWKTATANLKQHF